MEKVDCNALNNLSYGLYVLTAAQNGKDFGCIVNTVTQATVTPPCILATVNKGSHTHDVIVATGKFAVSVLAQTTPFEIVERFGYQSGRDADKFAGLDSIGRTAGGLAYLTTNTTTVLEATVQKTVDCNTHTIFVAELTQSQIVGSEPNLTYQYYHQNIKPKREQASPGYVCKVCGYIYEGAQLPQGFTCPLCKQGPEAFQKL